MKLSDKTISWAICLIGFILYLFTLEPVGGYWDSSEWIATAYKLEVGHPPGAPFYVLLARFIALFGFGYAKISVFLIAMVSALSSALCLFFLYHSIRMLVSKLSNQIVFQNDKIKSLLISGSSVIGSISFAVSDTFWHSATEAEVYSLSSLFVAIAFWAILKWEADFGKKDSYKWIYLIILLIGLSVSTHLLSLLVIPAIVFVYGFKKYRISVKNILLISFSALLILGFIVFMFIPGLTYLLAYSDVFFVNVLNLPLRSGMFVSFVMLWLLLFAGAVIASKKKRIKLQIILTMLLLLVTGYMPYGFTIVRSSANTPINEANPSSAYSFISYIEREQYEAQPLFRGQFFNSQLDKRSPYIKMGEHRMPINNKYVTTGIKTKPNYQKRDIKSFPRMWSSRPDHVAAYKEWSRTDGTKLPSLSENFRFFTRYQLGHMYWRYFMWNFVGRQNDIQGHGGPLYGNWISGINFIDKLRLGLPQNVPDIFLENKARNTYFFLPLILGVIGLVYQFKKDKKGFIVLSLFFVFTGIAIVFWLNQYPLQQRERDYSYLGSFYVFSIWIGLGSFAIFQFLKSKYQTYRNLVITLSLCFLIPLLMGVQNFDDHNKSGRIAATEMAYNYLSSLAPNAILFTNGDNDTFPLWYLQEVEGVRTDVRVINLSYLNFDWYIDQCRRKLYESDGIPLNLDYSAYYAGNRDYVYVYDHVFGFVDRIYEDNRIEFDNAMASIYNDWVDLIEHSDYYKLNSEEFNKMKKDFMFMAPHGKNPQFKAFRQFTENILKPESIEKYKINPEKAQLLLNKIEVMLTNQLQKPLNLEDVLMFVFSDKEDNKAKLQYSETPVNYFPTTKLCLKINKDDLLKTGTINKSQLQWAVDKMEWTIKNNVLTKSNLIVLEIINDNKWQRPIYFSVTVGANYYLGLERYFSLEGLAFRLMPIVNELSEHSIGYVDANLLYNTLKNNFKYDSYTNPKIYLDDNIRKFASNYRNVFGHCARALYFDGKIAESEEIIDLCLKLIPNERVAYEYYTAPLIHGYYRINKKKKAREVASVLAQNTITYFEFLASFDKKYQYALQAEEERCLTILQYLYRMAKEYNHKEYLPEIEEQYGKMLSIYDKIGGRRFAK